MAFTIRVPRGVVCGITSFNAPLNFVAHKVAPALASGNTVVIKAPQATPFSAALLCEILLDAGLPPAHINLVQGPGAEVGRWLVANPHIRFYTFTGSTGVGRQLHRDVGLRPIALELGSIAATIVCDDGDLDRAAATHRQLGVPARRPGLHVDPAAVRRIAASSRRFSRSSRPSRPRSRSATRAIRTPSSVR